MALRFLLDTNTVSFYLRVSSPALVRRMRATSADQVALSVVTEMEILFGLAKNPSLKLAPQIRAFLAAITVLPLTSQVSSAYARTRAHLEAAGTPIGPLDLLIASHALALDLTLVTTNLGEFERVPGLRCVDWSVSQRRT